jgi:hypothetical protein
MKAVPRPPSVSMACLFVGLSCVLLLTNVLSLLGSWNSLEVQEALGDALDDPRIADAGLSQAQASEWLRRGLLAVVVVLIAGVVFAVFASRGHAPSRIYLSVLSVVAAVAFVAFGGLLGLLPATLAMMCAVQLWSHESRTWFAVKNGRTPPPARTPAPAPVMAAPGGGAGAWSPDPAAPVVGPSAGSPAAPPAGRPAAVMTAGLITVGAAGIVAFMSAMILAVYAFAREEFMQAQAESPARDMFGLTQAELEQSLDSSVAMFSVFLPLSVLALVAGTALLMNRGWGRWLTLALAYVTVPLGILTLVGIPWTAAAIVVIVLLRRPDVREWFVRT